MTLAELERTYTAPCPRHVLGAIEQRARRRLADARNHRTWVRDLWVGWPRHPGLADALREAEDIVEEAEAGLWAVLEEL